MTVVRYGAVVVSLAAPRNAPIIVCLGTIGVEPQRVVIVRNLPVILSFSAIGGTTGKVMVRVVRIYPYQTGKVRNGPVVIF
jgi:hypothetical protein